MKGIRDILPGLETDVLLAPHTTFQIGGSAKYLYRAASKEDVVTAVRAAQSIQMPFFVLGGGSNLLVSDAGFDGLVIKIESHGYEVQGMRIVVDAGVLVETVVKETIARGLAGFEWAGGLPGTIGGAVRGNAGAFGGEMKDIVHSVEAIDPNGAVRDLSVGECGFSYRSSRFKEEGWIVLSAIFQLREGDAEQLTRIAHEHIAYRKEKHPLEYPNAGSVFKNCDVRLFAPDILEQCKDVIKTDPFPVVPTAFLLSQAGLKGVRSGDAEVSVKHPNYIINTKSAHANDVVRLIRSVKEEIKKKFGVALETEIEIVGNIDEMSFPY